jgi:hypothetical protein
VTLLPEKTFLASKKMSCDMRWRSADIGTYLHAIFSRKFYFREFTNRKMRLNETTIFDFSDSSNKFFS